MIMLMLTLLSFAVGTLVQQRRPSPLSNPTLIGTLLLAAFLLLSGVQYQAYLDEVKPLTMLLAPAVVALAVPLYRLRALLSRQWAALLLGGMAGTVMGVAVDTILPKWLHLDPQAQKALMTAPVTSPVALQLAQVTGAPPALAATLAVLSGLIGALVLPRMLRLFGIAHPLARGIAYGSVTHGIGTARAREESELTGAASSIGMGLAALVVTLLVGILG